MTRRPEIASWKFGASVVATFVVSLLGVGLMLLGPYLLLIAVAIAVPPALVVGGCAAFQRTRRLAIWLFRAFLLLVGWFCGLNVAAPISGGDKAFALEIASVFGFLVLLAPVVPFAVVGVVLLAMARTRRFGRDLLLSFILLPVGAALGWYISRSTIPEWQGGAASIVGVGTGQCKWRVSAWMGSRITRS